MPVPPRKRKAWPVVVAAVTLLALAGGAAVVLTTRKKPAGVTASAVDAAGASVPATTNAKDSDHDGLSDADEVRYHTNPLKADTDGDGFSDGTEVAKGFDPNGPGKLTKGANVNPTPTQPTTPAQAPLEQSGVALATVYSGNGSYTCDITGGVTKPNTVTVKIKGKKMRQETPLNGSTVVFIVDGTTFYMNGFKDAKWLKLGFDASTGTASGPGANIKGGIFATQQLVLAANPTKIACQEANWPDDQFTVPADKLLTQADLVPATPANTPAKP